MDFDAPSSAERGGGNFIEEPGTYHVVVTDVNDEVMDSNNQLVEGFEVVVQVLDGTTRDKSGKCTQLDRTSKVRFRSPLPTDKNEGEFFRKRQMRFFIATGLLTPAQLGKSGLKIDLGAAKDAQLVMGFSKEEYQGKERINLSFYDIFHVDDPDAAGFPKCEKSLKLLPTSGRVANPEAFFAPLQGDDKPKSPPPSTEKSEPAEQPAAAHAATGGIDIDDI